jgi:hypothetical protein
LTINEELDRVAVTPEAPLVLRTKLDVPHPALFRFVRESVRLVELPALRDDWAGESVTRGDMRVQTDSMVKVAHADPSFAFALPTATAATLYQWVPDLTEAGAFNCTVADPVAPGATFNVAPVITWALQPVGTVGTTL